MREKETARLVSYFFWQGVATVAFGIWMHSIAAGAFMWGFIYVMSPANLD